MYPTARQFADLARQRQQALLGLAAEARLIRRSHRSPGVPSRTSRSVRTRLATGLRALAAWIDDQVQMETPPIRSVLRGARGLEAA
jgi:hypothetical protein